MEYKKNMFSFIVLSFCFASQAQQTVATSGGDSSSSSGSVSYSIGQVVYTTNSSSSGSISQGVQQVYEISDVGITDMDLMISLSVFPNPTADNLTLDISDYNTEEIRYQLTDVNGKLLVQDKVSSNQTNIDMKNFPTSIYFLHVLNAKNKEVRTFKIIKQ